MAPKKRGRPIIGSGRVAIARSATAAGDETVAAALALMQKDKLEEAIDLLQRNEQRFSRHVPLRLTLAMLYAQAGDEMAAVEQARIALELSPDNRDAQLFAAALYLQTGFDALAHRARQAWLSAGLRQHPQYTSERELEDEYWQGMAQLQATYGLRNVKTADEAMMAMDDGRWSLAHGQWADALRHSRRAAALVPRWPPPRNNVATVLFQMGRPQEAARECEAVLRDLDPDNLHALAAGVRFWLAVGQAEKAQAAGDRLAALPLPENPETAVGVIVGLGLLDRDHDVDRLCTQFRKRYRDVPPLLKLYWGIAAANLGQRRQALRRVTECIEAGYGGPLADETLAALEEKQPGRGISQRYSYSHFSEWTTESWFDEVTRIVEREAERDSRDDRAWHAFMERFPQTPIVLRKLLYESDARDFMGSEEDGDAAITGTLRTLSQVGTPACLEILRTFALGKLGEQQHRFYALQLLQQAGVLPEGETVTFWIRGEPHELKLIQQEIVDEVMPSYPPAAWDAFREGLAHHEAGRLDEAELSYRRMLELAPAAKEAYYNLSTVYDARGDRVQAEALRDRALEIEPLYVYPHTARALRLVADGQPEQAREALRPLLELRRFDHQSFVAYQRALAAIALAEKRYPDARGHLLSALDVAPDDTALSEMLERVEMADMLLGGDSLFTKWDNRTRERRARASIPLDPTLADCFALLKKGDMTGIARVVWVGPVSAMRVKELRDFMLARYADADLVASIVAGLRPAELAALRDLLAHDGVMDWQAFSDAHGNDAEERPYMDYWAEKWESVMGRLRARGLLFEGTAAGRHIVAMPRELRPVVAALLAGD